MSSRPPYRDLPDGSASHLLDPRLGSLELLTAERDFVAFPRQLLFGRKQFEAFLEPFLA